MSTRRSVHLGAIPPAIAGGNSNALSHQMTAESYLHHGLTVLRWPAVLLLFLAFLPSTTAFAQGPAGPNRPITVPEGYVTTPSGYFHPSCVREVAEGDTLLENGPAIQHANGAIEKVPVCKYPHYTSSGEIAVGGLPGGSALPCSPWIECAETTIGTSYGKLTATWTVPPAAPTSSDGQDVAFFPGFSQASGPTTILQPVLAWKASLGGWYIEGENCCPGGNDFHGPIKNVKPLDKIEGIVQQTCSAGTISCPTWEVVASDAISGAKSPLPINQGTSDGLTFNRAFAGALEIEGVVQCTDYPPNGRLTFGIAVYDNNLSPISNPNWSTWTNPGFTPQCGYAVQPAATHVTLDFADQYQRAVFADHPVAYYRLGEAPSSTIAADSSGSRNTGTYENGAELGVPGLIVNTTNTAVNFASGDVIIPDAASLDFVGTPFSIEAWINAPLAGPTIERVWDKSQAGLGTGYGLDVEPTGIRVLGSTNFEATATVTPNNTHHLVGVSNGTTAFIYLDGVAVGSGPYGTLNPYSGVAHIAVANDGTAHFDGVIDEVAIYNYPLSPQRILAHYNIGIGNPEQE